MPAIATAYAAARAEAEQSGAAFDPVRPCVAKPTTGEVDGGLGGARIVDETAQATASICAESYDTMLAVMGRLFARGEESEAELQELAGAAGRLLNSVVRPLGEALTRMPTDAGEHSLRVVGPVFGDGAAVRVPAHRASARALFDERLRRSRHRPPSSA